MNVGTGMLPLLDSETLTFPQRFWPPTLAQDAQDARDAAEQAGGFAGEAETALTSTLAAAVYELRGEGQPGSTTETNTAPVGTYYTDTAGTNGAWRWLKTSAGSGVTRWKVVYGDTGWRDVTAISASLHPDNTGRVLLRREGNRVTARLENLTIQDGAGNAKILDIPAGFKGPNSLRNVYQMTRQNAVSSAAINSVAFWASQITYLETPGVSRPIAGTGGGGIAGEFSWVPYDTWPTPLPGTPA